ncbi:MAG: hypothetical protein ABWX71_02330 [Aeromicrobium sp.]
MSGWPKAGGARRSTVATGLVHVLALGRAPRAQAAIAMHDAGLL